MARIAFVNERMRPGFGVDLVIHELASEFTRRGHEVTVYASVLEDLGPRPYRLEPVPTKTSRLYPLFDRAARLWAGFIDSGDHDVAFINSFPFFSLIPALRTRAVAVDYGVVPTTGFPMRTKANFAYMRWTQQRAFLPKATAVVTISQFVRSLLPPRVASGARVVYCGVDHYPTAPPWARDEMRGRLGVAPGEVMLLYVGRLNPREQPYKGTRDLMECAGLWQKDAPKIRLVMAGRGEEDDAAMIRRAGALPTLDVPPEDMPALYAAADLYVTASRWEGFDLPLMEAAHQGVPGAALAVGAHPEVARHGETALLAPDVPRLRQAVIELTEDPGRLAAMGSAAREHASSFTWAKTAGHYEELLETLGRAGSGGGPPLPRRTDVTAVVLNYGASIEVLRRCVASLRDQTYPVEILLVDNPAAGGREALEALEREFPQIRVLRLERNHGFAGGMNRGVAAAETEFVLLLNNDTVLEPDAVAQMRAVEMGDDVVGVAPKILYESSPHVIDAIGNLIDPQGNAFNMGIGQLDIGQYDRVERTFGACFAAALLKKKSFEEGNVGPLDERYFMYYEDVDWCFRAGVLGFKFLTAPRAVVRHTHSLSTREFPYGFKYRLIMRNLLRTVIKDFEFGRAWRLGLRRWLGLARNAIRGPYRLQCLKVVIDSVVWLPVYLRERRRVQGRRRAPDGELIDLSHGEKPYFDPVRYAPYKQLELLEAMYRRLFLLTGEERHLLIAETAAALSLSRLRFDADFVRQRLEPLIASEPVVIKEFVAGFQDGQPQRR